MSQNITTASHTVDTCELCGSSDSTLVPSWITEPMAVRCCNNCSHLFTSPALSGSELQEFMLSGFQGDPGAEASSSVLDRLEQRDLMIAKRELEAHTIPCVQGFIDVRGRSWLEFRFRTGALLEILTQLGATVSGADFFAKNLANFRQRDPSIELYFVDPFDPFAGINSYFDVISGLSIHVLSHLPSPRNFLNEVHDHLSEGGLILLDEKDVLKVSSTAQTLPLAYPNPAAHYHHFTSHTFRALVESSGFEILYCDYSQRVSDLGHLLLIGRKSGKARGHTEVRANQNYDDVMRRLMEAHLPLLGAT